MGIKGLHKFLRTYSQKHLQNNEDIFEVVDISLFSYKKIAIDISTYIYKYKAIKGDDWLMLMINFIFFLRKNFIHPVFIFDGTPPKEKDKEKEERKAQKDKNEEKINDIISAVDEYEKNNIDNELLLSVMKKINDKNVLKKSLLLHKSKDNLFIDITLIKNYIEKKKKQIVNFDDIDIFKELLTSFNIQYIQAEGEAEALASYLQKTGNVYAVISEDSDTVTYGTTICISDIDTKNNTCKILQLKNVLSLLELTYDEFLDFCIMCGTDYNNNVLKCGIVTSYQLIKKYNTIENISNNITDKDFNVLNYVRGREIFKTYGDLKKLDYKINYWDVNIDYIGILNIFNICNYRIGLDELKNKWNVI